LALSRAVLLDNLSRNSCILTKKKQLYINKEKIKKNRSGEFPSDVCNCPDLFADLSTNSDPTKYVMPAINSERNIKITLAVLPYVLKTECAKLGHFTLIIW